MNLEEILNVEPFLSADDAKTGIYLIPNGKFGFTSCPVGDMQKKEIMNMDGSSVVKEVFVCFSDAVLVKPMEYLGLRNGEMCWENGRLIPYVKTQDELKLETLKKNYDDTCQEKKTALDELRAHDYISVKISEAMLMGEEQELLSLRAKYGEKIKKAKQLRLIVKDCEQRIVSLSDQITQLDKRL